MQSTGRRMHPPSYGSLANAPTFSSSLMTKTFPTAVAKAWQRLMYPIKPYWTANIYGFGKWIRRYGYYPPGLPLCVYTDHGAGDNSELPSPQELNSSAPVQFYHSSRKVGKWRELSRKPCYVLYSPFVFARRSLGITYNARATGTVYFPAHSTPSIEENKSVDVYHQEISSLPERYRPVTICLHIHDVRKGIGELYSALGYSVVTAGDSLDQRFTERFYRILSEHKYAVSNVFGSYGLYATEMGVPFGLFGAEPEYENKRDPNIEQGAYRSYRHTPYYQRAVELFGQLPGEQVTQAQREFANHQLGLEAGVSRPKMALILYKSLLSWLVLKFAFAFRKNHQNEAA